MVERSGRESSKFCYSVSALKIGNNKPLPDTGVLPVILRQAFATAREPDKQ
jgi:hypothetical protein